MERPSIAQQITFLGASDLGATATFYEKILALPLVLDQGTCRIYRTAGGAYLGFCKHLPVARAGRHVIVTLVSQEVDAWYEYLLNKGVEIEKPPGLNPNYDIYHFFVRDPNGYLVEVQNFLDPAWPAA